MEKPVLYARLLDDIRHLTERTDDALANYANTAACIYNTLPDINWSGFYFLRGEQLVLGPFQGRPACVHIPLGKGVCGTAALQRKTLIVTDVHAFPGHIACDPDSRSEIVIPLIKDKLLIGVLDIDSPLPSRFDQADARFFEEIATLLMRRL
ncbi:MAG: GAF domain-containing protein [FCB group bacterium]|nr:GAF domain-containing protein [FCB group bacterium]